MKKLVKEDKQEKGTQKDYKMLGLLVSKFKRGGVNWAYKIFARTHNFQYIRGKRTNCFYMKQIYSSGSLAQFEFVQIKIVINRGL